MSCRWESIDPRTGSAVPYSQNDSAALEQSYQSNPQGNHLLVMGGSVFTVDFAKMLQFNATGGSRKVVRIAGNASATVAVPSATSQALSQPAVASSASSGVIWESVDPRNGVHVPYSAADTAALEQSYQKNPKGSHTIHVGGAVFTVDFAQMLQFNAKGGSRVVVRTGGAAQSNSTFMSLMQQVSTRLGSIARSSPLSGDGGAAAAATSSTQGLSVSQQLAAALSLLTPALISDVVEAIERSDRLSETVVSDIHRIPNRFAPHATGPSLASISAKAAVNRKPVSDLITVILQLMTIGSLSSSDIDFTASSSLSRYDVVDLLSLGPNERVPQYYANVGGESIFRRKYLSVLGLRNLALHGFDIFSELFEQLFSSDPSAYAYGTGLGKMRELTGNTVDLDTVVLNCRTQLAMANKLLQDEATQSGRSFTPFRDPSSFYASAEARAMAVRQSDATLKAFVDLMQLSSTAASNRQVVLPPNAEQSIPTATGNTQHGLWPLWGYANCGVYTYHANAPHVPDVVGALLKAPFHLAKGFLMCLHASGVLQRDYFNAPQSSSRNDDDNANASNGTLLDLSEDKIREAVKKITEFFDKAVSDSCFNAKWKVIEAYVDEMTAMDDVATVIGRLQEKHQSIFTAQLFDTDDASRSKEQAALLSIIAKEGTKARDPQTRTIRLICKADVEKWIADTM